MSDELEELRSSVRRFLTDKSPSSAVRVAMDGDYDRSAWQQMASQLGLQGLIVQEEHGGLGYGLAELSVVLEEMGAALQVSPYFATVVLGAQTLLASGDASAQARWLPRIADGSLTATLALVEDEGTWSAEGLRTTYDGGLTGTKMFVVDGATADLLLVVARDGVYAVEAGAEGLTRTDLAALDPTRRLARVELDGVAAVQVGSGLDWLPFDAITTALAAEQVGGAQRCLDMSVAYAKVRVQFGRPIGSFQAIKHKLADVLLRVESARSAAYHAAAQGDAASAAVAGAYCADAFVHAAKESIQVHGGIGFTWEHDAHLYLKRAKSSQLLFGTPAQHRQRLSELAGIAS
ncbi:MAG: acd [Frankiales bacterium]|nr:acd [Frankiales bacterium]